MALLSFCWKVSLTGIVIAFILGYQFRCLTGGDNTMLIKVYKCARTIFSMYTVAIVLSIVTSLL